MAQPIPNSPSQYSPGRRAAFEYDSLWFWQFANNDYPSMEEAQRRDNLFPTTALRTTRDKRYLFSVVDGVVHRSYAEPGFVAILIRFLLGIILRVTVNLYGKMQEIIDVLIVIGLTALGIVVFVSYGIFYEIIYNMVLSRLFLAIVLLIYRTGVFSVDFLWSIVAGLLRVMTAVMVVLCVVLCLLGGGWSKEYLIMWTSWAAPAFSGSWYYPIWLTRFEDVLFNPKDPSEAWR